MFVDYQNIIILKFITTSDYTKSKNLAKLYKKYL